MDCFVPSALRNDDAVRPELITLWQQRKKAAVVSGNGADFMLVF
jgi:hypothetical protein